MFGAWIPISDLFLDNEIPVKELGTQLSYFRDMKSPTSWTGHFRSSPIEEKAEDAEVVIAALEDAQRNPIVREFDPRKLERKVNVYKTKSGKGMKLTAH